MISTVLALANEEQVLSVWCNKAQGIRSEQTLP